MTNCGEMAVKIVEFRSSDKAFDIRLGDYGTKAKDDLAYWLGVVDHHFVLAVKYSHEYSPTDTDTLHELDSVAHALTQAEVLVNATQKEIV